MNHLSNKIKLRSLIKEVFPVDCLIDLEKIAINNTIDTNTKVLEIERILDSYDINHDKLGSGTNRYGIMIDGYAIKIALDKQGMTDNKRELKYSRIIGPDVINVYECTINGLLTVNEYVTSFEQEDLGRNGKQIDHKKLRKMSKILSRITENFLIGDIGITDKNYGNWGTRSNSKDVCILDFAYIYSTNYQQASCEHCGSVLKYTNRYTQLICDSCNTEYSFGDIRKKITEKDEVNEIGEIRNCGYVIHDSGEVVEAVREFSPYLFKDKKEKSIIDYSYMYKKKKE